MSEPAQRFELNPLASDFVPGQAIQGHEEWKEELFNHLTKIENLGILDLEPTELDKKIFDEALLGFLQFLRVIPRSLLAKCLLQLIVYVYDYENED